MGLKHYSPNKKLSIKDGYVVYGKPYEYEGHIIAGQVYEDMLSQVQGLNIPSINSKDELTSHLAMVGDSLRQMAKSEQLREIALLKSFGLDISEEADEIEFITNINKVINGVEHYRRILEELKASNQKYRDLKIKSNEKVKSVAGNELARAIAQRLGHTVRNNLSAIVTPSLVTEDFGTIERKVVAALNKSVEEAVRGVEFSDASIVDEQEYEAIKNEMLNQLNDPSLKDKFVSQILNTFGLNPESVVRELKKTKRNKSGTYSKRDLYKRLNLSKFAQVHSQRQMAGNINEYIQAAAARLGMHLTIDVMEGTVTGASAETVASNMIKTDNVLMVSAGIEVDTNALADFLNEYTQVDSGQNQEETWQNMESILSKNLENPKMRELLSKSFLIYASAKTYGITSEISKMTIQKREEGNVLSSGGRLSAAGVDTDIIYAVLQTAANGYYENGYVLEQYKAALCQAMGQMMFDDWQTIGTDNFNVGDPQRIHVMSINSVYVPLSSLMNQMASAFQGIGGVTKPIEASVRINGVGYHHPAPPPSNPKEWEALWEQTRGEVASSSYKIELSYQLISKLDSLISALN